LIPDSERVRELLRAFALSVITDVRRMERGFGRLEYKEFLRLCQFKPIRD